MRKNLLPPKRHTKQTLEIFSIPLLVQHLAAHEQYARLSLKDSKQYDCYHKAYLSDVYAIGHSKNAEEFALEIAIARVDKIPFSWKSKS